MRSTADRTHMDGIGMGNRRIEAGSGFPWFAWRNRVKKTGKTVAVGAAARCDTTALVEGEGEFTPPSRVRSEGDRRTGWLAAWF